MGACQIRSKLKSEQQKRVDKRKKLLYSKSVLSGTVKNYTFESQQTIKTEQTSQKEQVCSILISTQNFNKVYTILNQYKPIRIGEDKILTIQHNINAQVRHARFIERSQENDSWIEIFLKQNFNHPNIIRVFEYYSSEKDYHILIQEQILGISLCEYIKPSEQIKECLAASLIVQVLQAIQYLHQNDIVHGRISQNSFFFAQENNFTKLKLVDYKEMYLRPELNLNSIIFIPPELITFIQQEKFSKEGDIWACGILSYIILNSASPYSKCKTMQSMQSQIMRGTLFFESTSFDKISNPGKCFIKRMLARLLTQRPTIQQALNDQWITQNTVSKKTNTKDTLNKLSQFKQANKLQFHIMIHMINVFFSQTFSQLINTFNEIDANKDGKVNMEEMMVAYKSLGSEDDAKDEVKQMFEKLDTDGSGDIDFYEFLIAVTDRQALFTIQNLQMTFQTLNISRNGRLTEQELSYALQIPIETVQENLPKTHIQKNGKAILDLRSFKEFMLDLL
ncbi:unnamed protein product (macronuclear) [Paramecium tetraurelia]|uniref:Protein kinase domain containing protein n=1 Tax=Paramecium tetraurelia TaxID=5888 RepID=A0CZX7_PARTE|nr:uncharacterized protein GSPATT00011917001 [Paramecium tetraurelia]CAK76344.1 unnamed protein product [Paramecium tetraurelia]|eukprot:XP_001443741.1 hypothetical protein (macronuclear) [Paramecium tetraurelia strain d4-2]